jgi:hypothetical protein
VYNHLHQWFVDLVTIYGWLMFMHDLSLIEMNDYSSNFWARRTTWDGEGRLSWWKSAPKGPRPRCSAQSQVEAYPQIQVEIFQGPHKYGVDKEDAIPELQVDTRPGRNQPKAGKI